MTTNLRASRLILALLGTSLAAPAAAQPDGGIPGWIEADPFAGGEHDPLGMDRGDGLEATVPTRASEEVLAHVPAQAGEVLTAIAGVREASHEVSVELAHGLAIVEVTMRFTSSARHAAEVRYRLAVPERASLAELEVCNAAGCRRGLVDASAGALGPYDDAVRSHGASGLPVARAASVEDERGHAVLLHAAPVRREGRIQPGGGVRTAAGDGPLTVRVRYVLAAPIRGGRARLAMPPRGRDTRAAPAQIRVRSGELSGARVDLVDAVESPVERASNQPWEITAQLRGAPELTLEAHRVGCSAGSCVRLRAVAAPQPARARDVILLLDASPSTSGPTRGRMAPALAAMLAALPSRARVRAAVFAARAEPVIEAPTAASAISLEPLTRALERELGSATRFEAAWARIEPWIERSRDPIVILVGDGGLTAGEGSRQALARARAAGAELASVNLADRATTDALRAAVGLAIDVGPEADRAVHGQLDALEERLAPLFAPIVAPSVRARVGARTIELGPLRAGEERAFEGALARGSASITGVAPLRDGIPTRANSGSGRPTVTPLRSSTLAGRTARASLAPDELALVVRDRGERAAGGSGVRLSALASESMADAAACGAGPRRSASAPVGPHEHLVLAEARRCEEPAPQSAAAAQSPAPNAPARGRIARIAAREGASRLPSRSLLELLRQRIVPVARGCFREDRRGRPNYQTRAVFEFRLADREVVDAEVTGRLTPQLRACLLAAIDTLDIPRFDGTVAVRYPIYTAPQLPPPTLTLDTDVADAVDGLIDP